MSNARWGREYLMELLFVDESGDDGLAQGSTDFYILAGVSIEDRYWKEGFS
jgi:hypothetical protein